MMAEQHHGERGLRDQIGRYRTAFISVVTMIVLAAIVGGYILTQERLSLPKWVPVLGKSYFTLRGDFSTAQAVTPGQGQAVTIAGAKIGEIARVDQHQGNALVTLNLTPKYARYIYRNATMLLRPKTQLNDMTVEVSPGTPAAGQIPDGYTVPLAQTAPNVNVDEFLSALDGETRAYLQELLAGVGEGLKGNAGNLSATLKRFDPIARYLTAIDAQLQLRSHNIEHGVHNLQLILNALGGKDTELAQLVDASNAVFRTFSHQDQALQSTLRLLPGALSKTRGGLGKLATATAVLGPTLRELEPFAKAFAPAEEANRPLFIHTAPVFKNEIRPFARRVLPVINQFQPSFKQFSETLPGLSTSFEVLNELVNELGYNPGPKQGGFIFFADWAAHDLNSALSTADAHGPLGRTLVYLNCNVLPLLQNIGQVNNTVKLAVALLKPPTGGECASLGLTTAPAKATKASAASLRHRGAFGAALAPAHSSFARLVGSSRGGR
jgi:phospholipid/cholesterol/gamma-HCH transport system substrate-binding protein